MGLEVKKLPSVILQPQCPGWVKKQTSSSEYSTSALPSTADIHQGDGYVSFVPEAEVMLRSQAFVMCFPAP
jgi:hypothetical protein